MSRLLFAAARGARIERNTYPGKWGPVDSFPMLRWHPEWHRIHPEDEALQYGPISSALREAAAAGGAFSLTSDYGSMARAYMTSVESSWYWMLEPDRSMFMLIVAEALADSGL